MDASTGLPKTGDAANITVYVSKDDGSVTALGDTSATEADATNAKGDYLFDLTQAETNADKLRFSGKSSTANVVIVPQTVYTVPANFTTFSVDGSGRVDVAKVGGTSQTARDLGASVLISSGTGTGQLSVTSGKIAATLASTDVTGNVAADVQTVKTQTVTCAAGVTVLASVGTAATSTAQTGDNFARIGAAGAGLTALGDARIAHLDADVSSRSTYAGADTDGTTTLLSRLTSTRAGLLDNLDAAVSTRSTYAGGAVASVTGSVGSVTGDMGGKVLGGGASTITGTGARVVDASGNALAPAATALSTAQWTNTRAGLVDNLDAAVSSRLAAGNVTVGGYAAGQDPATLVGALVIEGSYTLTQCARGWNSALFAKYAGRGTSNVLVRDVGDSKNRLSWTIDSGGNITGVTLNLS